MKFSIVAVVLPLIAGTSAAPSVVERQSPACVAYSGKFPHELVWGQWFLCCNYNGPDTTVRQDSVFNNNGCPKWRYLFTNETIDLPELLRQTGCGNWKRFPWMCLDLELMHSVLVNKTLAMSAGFHNNQL